MERQKIFQLVFFLAVSLAILFLISFSGKTPVQTEVNSFEGCVEAGFPVMESYPRKCAAYGETFVEEIISNKIYCTEDQRNVEFCTAIYAPVCGHVQVDCVTEPCDPVPETFPSSCQACSNERVEYYFEGEC